MIKLLSSGFHTSIQDLGRFNHTQFGVSLSGVMDSYLSILANTLVGNSENTAVVEMTYYSPKFKFLIDQKIAITAVEAKLFINGNQTEINTFCYVQKGDILEVKDIKSRAYLSISKGIDSEMILGSRSQFHSITSNNKLIKGDKLKVFQCDNFEGNINSKLKFNLTRYSDIKLKVYTLPEYNKLSSKQKHMLKTTTFTVSVESNRMAYQLEELIENALVPIISVPVMPGTVQLTPKGKLIILMKDAQVTGGYPRIFQLTEQSINILAQKAFRSHIKFEVII